MKPNGSMLAGRGRFILLATVVLGCGLPPARAIKIGDLFELCGCPRHGGKGPIEHALGEGEPVASSAPVALRVAPPAADPGALKPALVGTPVPAAAAEVPLPVTQIEGYVAAGFDLLAGYKIPGTGEASAVQVSAAIPEAVWKLDGRAVITRGYMLPVKMVDGLVTELLLVSNASLCCYGVTPELNQWMIVRLGKGVRAQMDVPVEFRGKLSVGPVVQDGYLSAIYQLQAEGV
jgi:hypothetical protein